MTAPTIVSACGPAAASSAVDKNMFASVIPCRATSASATCSSKFSRSMGIPAVAGRVVEGKACHGKGCPPTPELGAHHGRTSRTRSSSSLITPATQQRHMRRTAARAQSRSSFVAFMAATVFFLARWVTPNQP